jgi:GNAT superfamily N-acetyltransferase
MWFIKPVKQYHDDGPDGNWADFKALVSASAVPLGLIAYYDGHPCGWCAAGPRSRYVRAIKTPTYYGRNPAEDEVIWLVPCVFIREDARGLGLCTALVVKAMEFAKSQGAKAIEAFPYAGSKKRSRDTQVGFESVFAAIGFLEVSHPSESRIVMRATL